MKIFKGMIYTNTRKKSAAVIMAVSLAVLTGCSRVNEAPEKDNYNVISLAETTTLSETEATSESIAEKEHKPLVVMDRYMEILKTYPDIAGHITVPDTNIDYDFVHTDNNDLINLLL